MKKSRLFIALLRIALGWLFLYQGIADFTTAGWNVGPDIDHAQTFSSFYAALSNGSSLHSVSYVIAALFVIVGALLILGIAGRIASILGILLMLFFYFPLLHFPRVGNSYYLIDDHIIYCMILSYLLVHRGHRPSGLSKIL